LSSKAAKLNGVKKILIVPNNAYDHFLPENFATLIAEAATKGGFTHVIAAHGQFGKNTIPRVGALLDVQPIADIIQVQNEDTFVRQIYAGTTFSDC
jgi:electron transfer flavoprotein alpha subunit